MSDAQLLGEFIHKQFTEQMSFQNYSINPAYEGRGMMGRKCLAIIGDSHEIMYHLGQLQVLTDIDQVGEVDPYTAQLMVDTDWTNNSRDNFGINTVIYWSHISN